MSTEFLTASEAADRSYKALKAATDAGLVRTNRLWREQTHLNRLLALRAAKYGGVPTKFNDHIVMYPDIEIIKTQASDDDLAAWVATLRPAPFIPAWMMTLVAMEREWRRSQNKTEEEHNNIIQALDAGLRGDMDAIEAFFGIYDLNKEYEKELYGKPLVPEWSMMTQGSQFMTLNEVRRLNGLDDL